MWRHRNSGRGDATADDCSDQPAETVARVNATHDGFGVPLLYRGRLRIHREGRSELLAFHAIAFARPELSTADGENSVDKLCSDSGIDRTVLGESPASDTGNRPHGSAGEPRQVTVCGLPNFSNSIHNNG